MKERHKIVVLGGMTQMFRIIKNKEVSSFTIEYYNIISIGSSIVPRGKRIS